MTFCIVSMTGRNSKSVSRGVLVGCNRDRDIKRGETVVMVKPAPQQLIQKSQKLQNKVVVEQHKCCNMFTASKSSTTFKQYRHGITTHMLVEHATLAPYMQALLTLRGRNLHRLMNASLATTPEWTFRVVSDTRHGVPARRKDDSRNDDET